MKQTLQLIFILILLSGGAHAQFTEYYSTGNFISGDFTILAYPNGGVKYIAIKNGSTISLTDVTTRSKAGDITVQSDEYQSIGGLIPDCNKNGSDEVVIEYKSTDNKTYYSQVVDIKTNSIIKEFKQTGYYYAAQPLAANNNKLLLWVYHSNLSITPMTYDITLYDLGITLTPTSSAEGLSKNSPENYSLQQNFPNPFNPTTTIEYSISEPSQGSISIYDISGKLVKSVEINHGQPGTYRFQWNGLDEVGQKVASGMYIYQLDTGKFKDQKKMIMLK